MQDPLISAKLGELKEVLADLPVPVYRGKSHQQTSLDLVHPLLNELTDRWLTLIGWSRQSKVGVLSGDTVEDNGTVDFSCELPDGRHIVVEVQFGNGGRLERDFSKLNKLHRQGKLALGVLVYFTRATAVTADSAVAEYEKAVKRIDEMPGVPVCMLGLSREDSRTYDLRAIEGLPSASALGGKCKNGKLLRKFVADCINDQVAPECVKLPDALAALADEQTLEDLRKLLTSAGKTLHEILDRGSDSLKAKAIAAAVSMFGQDIRNAGQVPARVSDAAPPPSKVPRAAATTGTAATPIAHTDKGVASADSRALSEPMRIELNKTASCVVQPKVSTVDTPREIGVARRIRKEDIRAASPAAPAVPQGARPVQHVKVNAGLAQRFAMADAFRSAFAAQPG